VGARIEELPITRTKNCLVLLLAAPVVALTMTACGAGSVSAADVETQSEDRLEEQVGTRPDISCPEDLPAETGAELRCTLTAEGDPAEYGVTVTVTSVEGDSAQFDVQVDEQPAG
jgi:hypothetical protein